MRSVYHVHLEELDRQYAPVFPAYQRQTLWFAFDYWELEPRQVRPVEGTWLACEQGYVVANGSVELTVRQQRVKSGGEVGFIVDHTRCDHVLKNLANAYVPVLRVRVALQDYRPTQVMRQIVPEVDEVTPEPKTGTFDAQKLKWRDAIHGGCGQVATRHVLSPKDFYSDWTFLDHAILAPGGSVGYHYHDELEESFWVLKGQGLMTLADETFAVRPGSVTWQGIGQRHGMYNPGPENLEFVRMAVKQANKEYTTIDLHDDLSRRRPT